MTLTWSHVYDMRMFSFEDSDLNLDFTVLLNGASCNSINILDACFMLNIITHCTEIQLTEVARILIGFRFGHNVQMTA